MKRSKNLKNQRLFKMISLVFPVLFFNVFVVKSDFTYIECNDELCMYSDGEKRSVQSHSLNSRTFQFDSHYYFFLHDSCISKMKIQSFTAK